MDSSITSPQPSTWGTPEEVERHLRAKLAVCAYAYEIMHESLVSDAWFDEACRRVNLKQSTGNKKLDAWWRKNFDPSTGMWVHSHPDKARLEQIAQRIIKDKQMDITGPGRQKAIAAQLKKEINDWCANKYFDGHRWHLGASMIGAECTRALWYGFRWAFTATYIDTNGVSQKGRMGRLFNRGHREEERFVEWLRGVGFTVQEFDPDLPLKDGKPQQFRISDHEGHYGGSADGKVWFRADYGDMPPMLCEFKTSGAKAFKKLQDDGVQLAKPQHFTQMSTYGRRFGLEFALYVCINKDTDDLHIEVAKLDWNHADHMTTRAGNIIHSPCPPPKISENSAYLTCKFCDYAPVCHGQQPYEKNCRSCKNATPAAGGEWHCALFQALIPRDFVAKGCDSHVEAR